MSVRLDSTCAAEEPHELRVEAATWDALPQAARCSACATEHALHRDLLTDEGGLNGCLACGHPELYTQKAFPRQAGIAVVVVAAVLAPFTYYASLAVAALIDAGLYYLAPDVVVCYVCGALHRQFAKQPRHPHFDREIEERLKFGERAVMGKPMRDGGTAGAPEPEH